MCSVTFVTLVTLFSILFRVYVHTCIRIQRQKKEKSVTSATSDTTTREQAVTTQENTRI